jgi:hypothetical protein
MQKRPRCLLTVVPLPINKKVKYTICQYLIIPNNIYHYFFSDITIILHSGAKSRAFITSVIFIVFPARRTGFKSHPPTFKLSNNKETSRCINFGIMFFFFFSFLITSRRRGIYTQILSVTNI